MTNKPPRPPSLSNYRPSEDRPNAPQHEQRGSQHGRPNTRPQSQPRSEPAMYDQQRGSALHNQQGRRPPQQHHRPYPHAPSGKSSFGLGKIFLYGFVALLAVFAAGLMFLIVSPPTDLIRSQAIAAVKKNTGRDLTIKGSTSISFYPSLGISMGNVSLSSPPDMGGPPMVNIEKLTVAVKLLPLLSSEVVVDTLVLTRPVFDLRIDKSGRKNWDFAGVPSPNTSGRRVRLANADIAQKTTNDSIPLEAREFLDNATDQRQTQPSRQKNIASLEQLRLGDVRIIDGTILFTDVPQNVTQRIDALNVSVGLTSIRAPLKANGDLRWKDEVLNFDMTLTSIKMLMQERPAKIDTRITSNRVNAAFDGTLSTHDELTLDGALNADTKSTRALAGWLGTVLPQVEGFGPLSIQGRLKSKGSRHSILNAKIALDGAAATGNATLTTGGVRPHIKADLKLSQLDLNKYMTQDGRAASSVSPEPARLQPPKLKGPQVRGFTKRAGWSSEPFDLASLGAVDADAELSVGSLLYKKIKVDSSRLIVTLKDSALRADLSEMKLYKGRGRGIVTLNAKSSKSALIGANFAVNDIAVLPFLKDAAQIDWLSGTGNLTLAVNSQGANQLQVIEALNGKTSFTFNDGAIVGFNIPRAIRSFSQGQISGLDRSSTQQTDFSEFSATFNIKDGIASNTDLTLSSPLLRVTGQGDISLPNQSVDYTVNPKLVAELEGQGGAQGLAGIVVPIRIHGPFASLSYTPDISGILSNPDQALDTIKQLGEKLKTLKGKNPQDILDAILGGGDSGQEQENQGQEQEKQAVSSEEPQAEAAEPPPKTEKKKKFEEILDGIFGDDSDAEGEAAEGSEGQASGGKKKFDAKKLLDGLFGN